MNERGFTLLEVMVATFIMAIAVAGVMSSISTSLRNASRLTDYDRAALLGRQKMDELLVADKLQTMTPFQGSWGPEVTGGEQMGWIARIVPFEAPPNAQAGAPILERIELEIWWMNGDRRRTFALDSYRRHVLTPEDVTAGMASPVLQ
jgi:general secretion pathway protein I